MTNWKAVVLLAVTVPATAYVVSETVVDEPVTRSRSAITLADDGQAARSPVRPDEGVSVVRPCSTEVGDDDDDDRADDTGDDGDG